MLAIDIGNSAIKWGLWGSGSLKQSDAAVYIDHDIQDLLATRFNRLPKQSQVGICSVASGDINNKVSGWFEETWGVTPEFAETRSQQLGVVNAYNDFQQMGVDRWVAVIGAYIKYKQPVCVIDCGTAITLDVVDRDGYHQGGLIMPGLALMEHSLLQNTSGIENTQGQLTDLAKDTASAVTSGCIQLVASGLTQLMNNYSYSYQVLVCVITGGDAENVMQCMKCDCALDKDLILYGLYLISQQ